jgi:His-Xaa-Ser system radical SAM maturase HxsB
MSNSYQFLPFFFQHRNNGVLLTNDVGDYRYISDRAFQNFIEHKLENTDDSFKDLYGLFAYYPHDLANIINILAARYRTKKEFLFNFTTLHMIVLTKKCNQHCKYCHASSSQDGISMSIEVVEKCIDTILAMPSKQLKIEFQGGEPSLNINVLKHAVNYTQKNNNDKQISFVVCTNLLTLEDDTLNFYKQNNIQISTSLDGSMHLHDSNRIDQNASGTFDRVVENIDKVKTSLGKSNISALMTVTKSNLNKLEEVVNEYIRLGFTSVFIRSLNPFGQACSNWKEIGYSTENFLKAYKKILSFIIDINKSGRFFPEIFATIVLSRILTPFSTGFVDLQSPAGIGIQGVIYDVNGDVLVSDEARMYRNMTGDDYFKIGNVLNQHWKDIFLSTKLKFLIANSVIETLPMCETCVFQPYCGSDPVKNYALEKDVIGFKPFNDFCQRQKFIFDLLFDYLINGSDSDRNVLFSWVIGKN